MAKAMALRKELIGDDIITAEEWSAMYEKHGERYDRVLHAIATHPDYEHLRGQWAQVEEEVTANIENIVSSIRESSKGIKTVGVSVIPKLEMPEFDFPLLPSEIIAEDMKKLALVAEPELEAIMDQVEMGAAEATESVLKSLGLWLDGSGAAYKTHKDRLKEMTDFEQMALAEMVASYEGIIGTILSVLEKWAIGEIVKKVMLTLPFPANILATAGAIAAVKGIFATIKGMEGGGWVGEHGVEIIRVGERGREYVMSNAMTRNINNVYNQGGSQSLRITIMNRIDIGEQTLYKTTVHNINKAGELRDIIIPNQVVL
ncbi:hypothetical protein ES703_42170 [subsurface metagenome]